MTARQAYGSAEGFPAVILGLDATAGLPEARARGARLRVTGGTIAVVAAAPIGAVLFLPTFYFHGKPLSLWHNIPAAFALEPLGVAILAICAGITMAAARGAARQRLAAGILLAFGIQTILYSFGDQFGIAPPQTAGSAGIAGIIGGIMLLASGALGALGSAGDRAAPKLAGIQNAGGPQTSSK